MTTAAEFEQQVRDGIGAVAGVDTDGDRHHVTQEYPLGIVDKYRTVWLPETFRRSWEERLPALCWMHNLKEPIGRAVAAEVVNQNHRGEKVQVAQVRSRFSRFAQVPQAERAFVQIEDGDLTDFSFGFTQLAPGRAWRGSNGVRAEAIPLARMNETSPVTIGAIPGAMATSVREETGMAIPTLEEIMAMRRHGLIDAGGAAELARQILPEGMREHIVVSATRDDGTDDDDPSPEDCAEALDATLDAAQGLIDGLDEGVVDGLPADLQQALALVAAAGVTSDALLDAMGIDDPDDVDDDPGVRADLSNKAWSGFSQSDYTPAQWAKACLIDKGEGDKDSKDRYALPVLEPDGTLNKAALSAAAGRLNQVDASEEAKKAAAKKLMSLYNQAGMKVPGSLLSSTRSAPEMDETAVAEAEAIFARLG